MIDFLINIKLKKTHLLIENIIFFIGNVCFSVHWFSRTEKHQIE
jgi:hypothetical protein